MDHAEMKRRIERLESRNGMLERRDLERSRGNVTEADVIRHGSGQGRNVRDEYVVNAAPSIDEALSSDFLDPDAEAADPVQVRNPFIELRITGASPRFVGSEDGFTVFPLLTPWRFDLRVTGDLATFGPFQIIDENGSVIRVRWALITLNGIVLEPTSYGTPEDSAECQYIMNFGGDGFSTTVAPRTGARLRIPLAFEKL